MTRVICLIFLTVVFLLPIHAGGKKALLIGISEYPEIQDYMSWDDIHGANDVDLLQKTLRNQGFTVTTCKNADATADNIRNKFAKLIKNCQSGDLVVLHFSGHGQPYEDLSHDEEDGWDESIIPYDAAKKYKKGMYEGKSHITDDELHRVFNSLRKKVREKGFVYVILDACHSGSASREDSYPSLADTNADTIFVRGTNIGFSPNNRDYSNFRIDKRKVHLLKRGNRMADICILEACMSHQVSTEINVKGTYYGPLSYYVNKVLTGHTLTNNIKWVDLVRKEMNNIQRQTMVIETSVR